MFILPKPGLIKNKLLNRARSNNPKLTVMEIEEILLHYDVESWKIIKLLGGGNSDNILIQTDKGKRILKKYYWSKQSTAYEHSILKYLTDKKFPISLFP